MITAAQQLTFTQAACDGRLRDALLEITEHPERWDQSTWGFLDPMQTDFSVRVQYFRQARQRGEWPCGTSCCLAGMAAVQSGLSEPDPMGGDEGLYLNHLGRLLLFAHPEVRTPMTEERSDFQGLGMLLFGISRPFAQQLFAGGNCLSELWRIAENATKRRVRLPVELYEQVDAIDARREGPR